jgi:alpha-beta hydrolase superfamily lysophospholipase
MAGPAITLTTRGTLEFPNLLLSVQYVVVEFQYVVVIFQFSERKFSDTPTSHTAQRNTRNNRKCALFHTPQLTKARTLLTHQLLSAIRREHIAECITAPQLQV